ncbi:VOC family protein [Pontibacter sp. G13]|uniref:VOC family protein n=1 Tax=Pontibacter sp. G13 TaxID=3074898 RepID=UPI00288B689F|nr:VOC family protein [Pontibacter sp. G13]WNJ20805.1 VOC family protein [Pontibacter sp. G13]
MEKIISGIQQVGIGIPNVHDAFKWYRQNLGMDVPIFEEAADAELMLPYTGGEPRSRHAILAVNLQGGGGFEIWQYTSRTPELADFQIQLGDLGIYVARMKCLDVDAAHKQFTDKGLKVLGPVHTDPSGSKHFFLEDPYGNIFQIIEGDNWFTSGPHLTGGPEGVMIGVSDIDKAREVYSDILGYDTVLYDETDTFEDLKALPGGEGQFRRVLLTHSKPRQGGFSRIFGPSRIELVVAQDRTPRKMFENRFWGDRGYIHLCFDIIGMDALRDECAAKGYAFTVDSAKALGGDFDMGEAAGSFSYIEDADGTLIEFVETYKVPLLKKLGWYLDMKKRDPKKPLPDWMLKALRFNRVKD